MKEILFRGKTTKKENGAFNNIWVYGDLIISNKKYYIHPKNNVVSVNNELGKNIIMHEIIPESLGQYTEYERIYQNDIIKFKGHLFKIVYGYGSPMLVKINDSTDMYAIFEDCWNDDVYPLTQFIWNYNEEEYEVIGNTTDNPELLEVE